MYQTLAEYFVLLEGYIKCKAKNGWPKIFQTIGCPEYSTHYSTTVQVQYTVVG